MPTDILIHSPVALLQRSCRLLLACLLFIVTPLAVAQDTLTLGVYTYRPKPVMEAQWTPLIAYFNAQLQPHTRIQLRLLSQDEMQRALQNGELDLLYTNPTHYIQLRASNRLSGALATQLTLESGQAVSQLGGVIIRRHDRQKPNSLAELADSKIAIAGKRLLGGYTAQAAELKLHGINPDQIDFLMVGGTHDEVVEAILDGRADAGFIRTGILERMLQEGKIRPGQIEIIASQHHAHFPFVSSTRLYPEWPFIALPHVPNQTSKRIAALLYNLDDRHPTLQAAGIYGFTIPADYSSVEAMMHSLKIPPFDGTPEFGWQDIWQRYRIPILLGILLTLAVSGLASVLFIGNRRLHALRLQAESLSNRLQQTINATRAGTWEWNVQTGETIFNTHWTEMLGYRLDELQPASVETWKSLVHPDDLSQVLALIEDHFRGEIESFDMEVRLRHKDGHWIWVQDRGSVTSWTADGKPEWMFGTHTDISTRHALQSERDALLQRFRELASNVPGVLYQFRMRNDGSSHFPYATDKIFDIYGCHPQDVVNDASPVFSILHPGDIQRISDSIEKSAKHLRPWHEVYRVNHPTLGLRWVEGNATPTWQDDGSVTWHGHIRDITELHHARERLRLAASVFETSREGIYITDTSHRVIEVNQAFTVITGYTFEDVRHHKPSLLFAASNNPVAASIEKQGTWSMEVWLQRKSGEEFPAEITVNVVADMTGAITHHVAAFSDISIRKAHECELNQYAHFDALTGIPNRRLLDDRLSQGLSQAKRENSQLAVCMLDLDGFKPVNDQFGHEAGDQVLVEIARRLKNLLRGEDTVARLGGDEFVLLLRNPDGERVFQRVLDAIRQPITLTQGTVQVSASMGVVFFDPEQPCDGGGLLRIADQATYRAKAMGRNQYVIVSNAGNDSSVLL